MSKKPYNTDPMTQPCQAVIVLAVGQELTAKGEVKVKHVNEEKFGKVETIKITAQDAHDLRMALYRKVNELVDGYIDAVNGN